MPHIDQDWTVLSEVDKDLSNFYKIASRMHYKSHYSRDLAKFILTRFIDDISIDKPMNREETEETRELLQLKLKKMKILEVGRHTGFADYFGQSDYVEDLYFLNGAMNIVSDSKDAKLENDYDLIYATYQMLPSTNRFYDALQDRWDKEHGMKEKSYWGTDDHAYRLLWDVRTAVIKAHTARLKGEKIELFDGEGIDLQEKIQLFQELQKNMDGLADLHNPNYLTKLLNENLTVGGVFMDYNGDSPKEIENMKLFDLHEYRNNYGKGCYNMKSKQTFKKIS